jgi:hypothetical protein
VKTGPNKVVVGPEVDGAAARPPPLMLQPIFPVGSCSQVVAGPVVRLVVGPPRVGEGIRLSTEFPMLSLWNIVGRGVGACAGSYLDGQAEVEACVGVGVRSWRLPKA